jgi:RHS repeat-associated protein
MNPGVDSPPGLNVGVNGNNQITNTGFSYDAAGNSLQDGQGVGSHSYTWDGEERLVQVDSGSTWSYTYNALGQRVEWLQPGVNNELLYDPAGNLVGNWGSWSLVALGSRNNWAMYINGKTVFSHPNNLGSSVMQTDFSGAVVQDMTYYPWGAVWQSPQTGYTPYFAGMIYDGVANKNLTTYRQFSPNLGRWLSPDPEPGSVNFPQGQNLYAYVKDNPTTLTDPRGLGPSDPYECNDPWFAESHAYCQQAGWAQCLMFPNDPGCFSPGGGGGGGYGVQSPLSVVCDCILNFRSLRCLGCWYSCSCSDGTTLAAKREKCSIFNTNGLLPCPGYVVYIGGKIDYPIDFCGGWVKPPKSPRQRPPNLPPPPFPPPEPIPIPMRRG